MRRGRRRFLPSLHPVADGERGSGGSPCWPSAARAGDEVSSGPAGGHSGGGGPRGSWPSAAASPSLPPSPSSALPRSRAPLLLLGGLSYIHAVSGSGWRPTPVSAAAFYLPKPASHNKLLLGEDMFGSGKGVRTALAISNAITNLSATVFGDLWRLEPLAPARKAMWTRAQSRRGVGRRASARSRRGTGGARRLWRSSAQAASGRSAAATNSSRNCTRAAAKWPTAQRKRGTPLSCLPLPCARWLGARARRQRGA